MSEEMPEVFVDEEADATTDVVVDEDWLIVEATVSPNGSHRKEMLTRGLRVRAQQAGIELDPNDSWVENNNKLHIAELKREHLRSRRGY